MVLITESGTESIPNDRGRWPRSIPGPVDAVLHDRGIDQYGFVTFSRRLSARSRRYLQHKQNLIWLGATGCGKTGLATSFLIHAIDQGYSGHYVLFAELIGELEAKFFPAAFVGVSAEAGQGEYFNRGWSHGQS